MVSGLSRAEQMPYTTAFANVIDKVESFVPHVGMDYSYNPNNVGNDGGFLGRAPCGDADAWRFGVSFENPPPPCQCQREDVIPIQEQPAGLINATNRAFTLSQVPMSAASVLLMLNGVVLTQTVDYSVAGANLFLSALNTPPVGAILLAYYWVQT